MSLTIFLISRTQSVSDNTKNVKLDRIIILIWVYFAIQLLASVMAGDFQQSFWGEYYRYQGLLLFFCLSALSTVLSLRGQFAFKFETIAKVAAISGIFTALMIIIQAIAFFVLKLPVYTYNGRMTALLGNAVFAAGILLLAYFFADFTFGRSKILKITLFLLFLTGIILTQSRAAIALILLLGTLWHFPEIINKKIFLFSILILPVMITNIVLARPQSSFDNRALIWRGGFFAFLQRPILGWGTGGFERAFNSQIKGPNISDLRNIRVDKAHNEFLEVLVTSGIVGLAAYIYLLYQIFKTLYRNIDKPQNKLLLFVFIAYVLLAQTNVVSITSYFYFYLLAELSGKILSPASQGLALRS